MMSEAEATETESGSSSGPGDSPHSLAMETQSPPARLLLWALAAGLLSGGIGSVAGEVVFGRFKPVLIYPPGFEKLSPFDKPNVISDLLRKELPATELKNTAAAAGLLGASLAGTLGLVGGLARRSPAMSLLASLFGAIFGAVIGAVSAAVVTPTFFKSIDPESGMDLGMWIHSGLWGPLGAVAGLAFGIGLKGSRGTVLKAILGGLAGAIVGTLAYELFNAVAFPNLRLDKPLPEEWRSRVLAAFCVTITTSLCAALALGNRSGKKSHA